MPWWYRKPLAEMTPREWESLCDGCGRCCLHKLEDVDSGLLFYTDVACRLLDQYHCRCTHYQARRLLVPDCLLLSAQEDNRFDWLPSSCAYRKLANGQALEWWHPLISGNPETVHEAGISVRGRVVSEKEVPADRLEDHVITWIDF